MKKLIEMWKQLISPPAKDAVELGPILERLEHYEFVVEIADILPDGMIQISLPMTALGLAEARQEELHGAHTHFLVDLIGELLVRRNLDRFRVLIRQWKDYDRMCKQYVHRRFVFRKDGDTARFYFHCSLLQRMFNEEIARWVDDATDSRNSLADIASEVYGPVPTAGQLFFKQAKVKVPAGVPKPSQLFETVVRYFTDDGWKFQRIDGVSALLMGVSGHNGEYNCMATVREEMAVFIFRTKSAIKAPIEQRLFVAEFVARANYGLLVGDFEFDFADGEISYKTSIDVEGDQLTAPLIRSLVHANVCTFDRYYPGLMQVLFGQVKPEDAVKAIEQR